MRDGRITKSIDRGGRMNPGKKTHIYLGLQRRIQLDTEPLFTRNP
jgi:hypothetical protein